MKKILFYALLAVTIAVTTCCTAEDPFEEYNSGWDSNSEGINTSSGSSSTTGELATFDIAIDKTTAEPTAAAGAYYPDEEDNLENNEFTTEVNIDLSNPVAKTENGVEVTVSGGHVTANHGTTKKVCYVLSGTTANGSFTVVGEKKYAVRLNGASITNPDSAALNLLSDKRAYIILTEGTTNTLADGTNGSQKGALYCKGKLLFNGSGQLSVTGNTNNGIHSADYIVFNKGNNIYVKSTANHGVKANDGIFINGGILNVEVSAAATKGINCESHIIVNGGRTTVMTTGNGTYDSDDREAKGAACIKADSTFTINGGELLCKSTGKGGKGISTDQEFNMKDGTVKVITTGTTYSYGSNSTKAKGIKADGNITVDGGSIMVRATGDSGSEGFESKKAITINSGSVEVYSYDDAINSAYELTLNGGYTYAFAINNDGLDANRNLYVKGGTTVAYGTTQPECGIDANEEQGYSVIVTGGTLIGVGGGTSYPSSSSTQPSIVFGGSVTSGSTLALNNGDSNVLAFEMGRSYNGSACFLITSPSLKKGNSYTLYNGASVTGTDWHGLIASATLSSTGTSVASVSSLSSPYSTCGSTTGGMGGMGGGMPGRH